jgi:hypothetical protein
LKSALRSKANWLLVLVLASMLGAAAPKPDERDGLTEPRAATPEVAAIKVQHPTKTPVQPPPTCNGSQQDRQYELCAQWQAVDQAKRSADAANWSLLISVAATVVGAGTLLAAMAAAIYAKHAAAHAARAATAAEGSRTDAQQAIAQADRHANQQLRPWIAVSVEPASGITYPEVGMHIYFNIRLRNVGSAPARSVRLGVDFKNQRLLTDVDCQAFYEAQLLGADESPEAGLVMLPNEEITKRVGVKIFRKDFPAAGPLGTNLFPLLMISVVYRSDLIAGDGKAQTAKTIFMSEKNDEGGRAINVERGPVDRKNLDTNENGLYSRAT